MQKSTNQPNRPPSSTQSEFIPTKSVSLSRTSPGQVGTFWDMLAIRLIFTAVCVVAGYHFRPFSVSKEVGAAAGLTFAIAVILFEVRLRRASLRRLIGAAIGSIMGILGSYLTSLILMHTTMPGKHALVLQPGDLSGDDLHRAYPGRE